MICSSKNTGPGWLFCSIILIVMGLLQLFDFDTLRYQENWLSQGEYWRIVSGHWIHVNWPHLLLNALGLMLCMGIASPVWSIKWWVTYNFLLALGISLLFTLLNPELEWYAGYSGVLYGIFLLAAFDLYERDKLIAVILAIAIISKILLEQIGSINVTSSKFIGTLVVTDAHYYGVLLAILIALVQRLFTILKTQKSDRI